MKQVHNLHTTDELVAAYQADVKVFEDPEFEAAIARAIPAAIDAVYAARDSDMSMHGAGAAAAMEALWSYVSSHSLTYACPECGGEVDIRKAEAI